MRAVECLRLRDVGPFDDLRIDLGPRAPSGKADIHVLTGPNGTGKTTILMALAAFFGGGPTGGLNGLLRRRRSSNARVDALIGGAHVAKIDESSEEARQERNRSLLADVKLRRGRMSEAFFFERPGLLEPHWERLAAEERGGFEFAAMAYAGGRSIHSHDLVAIQELRVSPLAGSLSFEPRQSGDLVQWIANTKAKEAFAKSDGKLDVAARHAAAIQRIEQAIREVVDMDVRFEMNTERLRVTVVVGGRALDLDLLPEGLRSILSWVADLLMRLDRIAWATEGEASSRPFLLLLDEIDVHLHPAWQRKVLPMVQKLFPSAQVVVTTHSPLVVGSVSDAWIYPLAFEGDRVVLRPRLPSAAGQSYASVLKSVFGIDEEFDLETETLLDAFRVCRDQVLTGQRSLEQDLRPIARTLEARGLELRDLVGLELRQLERRLTARP
jgi:predicted ATPase